MNVKGFHEQWLRDFFGIVDANKLNLCLLNISLKYCIEKRHKDQNTSVRKMATYLSAKNPEIMEVKMVADM